MLPTFSPILETCATVGYTMGPPILTTTFGGPPIDNFASHGDKSHGPEKLRRLVGGLAKGDNMNLNFHFDNDAHVDDLVAFILLQSAIGDKLLSVTVSNGDSIMASALETYKRLFVILGGRAIRLGAGQKIGRNGFPMAWRAISDEVNKISLISKNNFNSQTGKTDSSLEVLRSSVRQGPMRLITTGPLTNIAEWLRQYPDDLSNVRSLVMMGGALNAAGNVHIPELSDGTAEWNFFADPEAAETVLKSGIPVSLIPLDVAGLIPVTADFISLLSRVRSIHGTLAYQLWNLVYRRHDYFLWDVVATIAAVHPELFAFEQQKLSILQEGRAQGRLIRSESGVHCQIAVQMDKAAVLNSIMDLLNKTS